MLRGVWRRWRVAQCPFILWCPDVNTVGLGGEHYLACSRNMNCLVSGITGARTSVLVGGSVPACGGCHL